MKRLGLVFIVTLLTILAACGQAEETNQTEETTGDDHQATLTVMTTIYPLQFFTNEIGGEFVEATSILPAGSDAHTYEPTSKEMIAIAGADLFIYNETQSESYATKIEEALADESVIFLEASSGLDMITYLHDHAHDDHSHADDYGHSHGDYDAHVWLSPQLSIELSENILNELIALMPEEEAYFRANYDDLVSRLEALDEAFETALQEVPNKTILVTHAAYNYWARDYGIEQLAVTGLSPSNEPSQQQLIRLIDLVKERHIDTILFEQNISSQVSEVIKEEAGLETNELHNLATLRTEDIDNEEDYFSLMMRNLDVLVEVLSN